MVGSLQKLVFVSFKSLSFFDDIFLGIDARQKIADYSRFNIFRGIKRNDNEKHFVHNIRHGNQLLNEVFVFRSLQAQKFIGLFFFFFGDKVQIFFYVQFSRTDQDLQRKIQ